MCWFALQRLHHAFYTAAMKIKVFLNVVAIYCKSSFITSFNNDSQNVTSACPVFHFLCWLNFALPQNPNSVVDSKHPSRWNLGFLNQSIYLPEHQRIPLRINSCFGDTAAVVVIASLAVSLHPLPCNILCFLFFFYLAVSPPPTVPPPPVSLMFSHFLFPYPLHFFRHPHHFLPYSPW